MTQFTKVLLDNKLSVDYNDEIREGYNNFQFFSSRGKGVCKRCLCNRLGFDVKLVTQSLELRLGFL